MRDLSDIRDDQTRAIVAALYDALPEGRHGVHDCGHAVGFRLAGPAGRHAVRLKGKALADVPAMVEELKRKVGAAHERH